MTNHWFNSETNRTVCGEHEGETGRAVSVDPRHLASCPDCVAGVAKIGEVLPAGEVRVTSETGGQKGTKAARFDLLPADALAKVAELYGFGATKYEDHNWRRGYAWSLSFAALQRHAWAFWNGEDTDAETGLPHMASVAFHALALIEFAQAHPDFDDRFLPAE